MAERVLDGRWMAGLVRISEAPPAGMIALHAVQDEALAAALERLGLRLPEPGGIFGGPSGETGWMGPRELLVVCQPPRAAVLLPALKAELAGRPSLAADVSEAHVGLRLDGVRAGEVLAKLVPLELLDGTPPPGSFVQSRLGPHAAALRFDAQGATVYCGRPAAAHAFELLAAAARAGGEIG
ncbi:sarcosine oxidase subunit gamma [Mangrovicoccus sp. HB161399]|uniref:sarcosine oxidase subunit gamma n=1 Tax=Mangrovicoccus sp. HB161399 TaxID=2720392 RepID=UPI0015535090|nr:hypothetical protein [Mangrovicoccus sp. HB161399]